MSNRTNALCSASGYIKLLFSPGGEIGERHEQHDCTETRAVLYLRYLLFLPKGVSSCMLLFILYQAKVNIIFFKTSINFVFVQFYRGVGFRQS